MTDEDNSQGTDAAEAFEAMCVELALLRRAVEGLAAERGAIDFPDYTETLGRMQKGVDATADRIAAINDVIARSPALAMTPEQMAQRIAAAGSAARREDQAALAKAGEDKARVMAELRAIAGSAWTRADQRNRQLWFALGGWRPASSHGRSCRASSRARSRRRAGNGPSAWRRGRSTCLVGKRVSA
ncbi:hypothetical protein [Sphingomonas yabuuchiae]|uniref:hypothetical protein n=1 Tax=Sphingomonas yabuuchiae TaxID=172044 RepID=UPI00336EB17F